MTDTAPRQKPSGTLTFQLGLFSLTAEAVPVRVTSVRPAALKQICPDCLPTPVAPKQIYRCDAGHEHPSAELAKARPEGTGKAQKLIPLTQAEVDAIKAPGPDYVEGVMEIQVCDAAELDAATLPDDAAYRVRPDAKSVKNYALLMDMCGDASTALYGVVKVGSSAPKPYRLRVWEGQLTMQSLIRPENIADRDNIEQPEANDKLRNMAAMLVEQVKAPFDAKLLADSRVERLAAILAAKETGASAVEAPLAAPSTDNDLMAMLEASLAAAK
jgi:non-homologous end joining protein Ku